MPFTLLQAIADVPEHSLRRGITGLQAAEFLYETGLFPDLEYTFKHALTHEVAYGTVLQDRRRMLHARIMEALEAVYSDRLAEQVERLGHHALRGEVWEKAATYLRQAGAKALARSAYREAVTCFEQALAALRPLPDTRQKIERAIDLRLDLRLSLFPLNELATVWRYLQEAEGLASTLDDPRRLGWVSAYLSGHHVHTGGHVTEVRTSARRVETIAERLGDAPLQIAAQYYLAAAAHRSGDSRETERLCRRLIQLLQGQPARERFNLVTVPAVWSRAQLARALAERGVFDEGESHGKEAIRIAEAIDHPFSALVACIDLAHLESLRGELSQAARLLERAVAQGREWNITNQTPIAMASASSRGSRKTPAAPRSEARGDARARSRNTSGCGSRQPSSTGNARRRGSGRGGPAPAGPAARSRAKRATSRPIATRPSIRASHMPAQAWMPVMKARCRLGVRARSSRSGSGNCAGSRLAAPMPSVTSVPAGSATPPIVTSATVRRLPSWLGLW